MLSAPEGLHRIKLLLPELFLVSARRRLQRLPVGRNWQRQWHEEGPGGALPLPHTASKARGADGAHPTCPRRGSFCKDGQVLASPLPYETLPACGGHGVEAGRQVFQAPWASTVGAPARSPWPQRPEQWPCGLMLCVKDSGQLARCRRNTRKQGYLGSLGYGPKTWQNSSLKVKHRVLLWEETVS